MELTKQQNQLNKQHNLKSCIYDHIKQVIDNEKDTGLMQFITIPFIEIDYSQFTVITVMDDAGNSKKIKKFGVVTQFDRKKRDQTVEQLRTMVAMSAISNFAKVKLYELVRFYKKMDKDNLGQTQWKNILFILDERYGKAYY